MSERHSPCAALTSPASRSCRCSESGADTTRVGGGANVLIIVVASVGATPPHRLSRQARSRPPASAPIPSPHPPTLAPLSPRARDRAARGTRRVPTRTDAWRGNWAPPSGSPLKVALLTVLDESAQHHLRKRHFGRVELMKAHVLTRTNRKRVDVRETPSVHVVQPTEWKVE